MGRFSNNKKNRPPNTSRGARGHQRPSLRLLAPSSSSSGGSPEYFNYMGMLAIEGTYDKMEALLSQNIHPNLDLSKFNSAASEAFSFLNPTREDIVRRVSLINEFKEFIQNFEEIRGCTLEPYGSFATGLYTRLGDIDLSVQHENQDILSAIYCRIYRCPGRFSSVEYKKNKRVPVLKFRLKDQGTEIPFDLTLPEKSGKRTALLLSEISKIDDRFRVLILLVKGWAMRHSINDASNGGLKSYALYVMVIFHCQTMKPPILPPLSELCTREVMQKLEDGDKTWKHVFAENVTKFRRFEKNMMGVYEVFFLFIKEFRTIRRKAETSYISVKLGQWDTKKFQMLEKQKQLWVEEPFGEELENLAKSITNDAQLRVIGRVFKNTYKASIRGEVQDILKELISEELIKVTNKRDEFAMPSSAEVGQKAETPPKVLIPAKTKPGDIISDDEQENVISIPSPSPDSSRSAFTVLIPVSSTADVLGLGYVGEEDDKDSEIEDDSDIKLQTAADDDDSVQDKELSSSTSRLSLGTHEFSQNDATEDEVVRDEKPKGISRNTRFSVGEVEDPKAARSRNHHKSDSDRHRESEGAWQDEDLYLHAKRRRDENNRKRERGEDRMSRNAQKVRECERSDKDRQYSKIGSEGGRWKDNRDIHENRIKEGVEKKRDRNEWKERVECKTWTGHSRLKEDCRGENIIESRGKQARRDRIEDERYSRHAGREDAYSHGNRVIDDERRRSRYERVDIDSGMRRVREKKHKDNIKRGRERDNVSHTSLAPRKKNQEDYSLQRSDRVMVEREKDGQNHRNRQSRKHREDVSSEDEDSKRGRSKLERWTSHKDIDLRTIANVDETVAAECMPLDAVEKLKKQQ